MPATRRPGTGFHEFFYSISLYSDLSWSISFYPLQPYSYDISKKVSIADLDYRGILSLGDKDMALFSWKHDGNYRFLLKSRKLYCSSNSTKSSNEQVVDGIVGDITGTEVVLIQGEQKIVFSRRK